MGYTLEALREQEPFRRFFELTAIPRGSGNTAAASEYVARFAAARALEYERDALGNVVIKKPASPGREGCEPIMLQGHLDMVCAAESGRGTDMSVTPPQPLTDGEWIFARGTTLGADNGIAIAMMLALLDDGQAVHPPLVCVFTVDEETGMYGAYGLDKSRLGARRMLNLDAEREGELYAGCAGGNRAVIRIPAAASPAYGDAWRIELTGLAGGHSGVDIDRGRATATALMGRVLAGLRDAADMRCARFESGQADNAIAESAAADVVCAPGFGLEAALAAMEADFRAEYGDTEPGLRLTARRIEAQPALDCAGTDALICLLLNAPQGVIERSARLKGMPQTSCNLGVVRAGPDGIYAEACARSSSATQLDWLNRRIESLARALGGSAERCRGNAAWEFAPESPLRGLCARVWRDISGAEPEIKISHAAAECGIFAAEMPGLDCVALGPTIENAHTTRERLNIASAIRVYGFLRQLLGDI